MAPSTYKNIMLKSSPLPLRRHLCWKEVWVPLSSVADGLCSFELTTTFRRKSNCGKRYIRGHVSSGGCGCTQRCPDERRKSCVWTWGVCEWRREGEHMGRRLGQYIPFSESRWECQEPDPKSSAMRSLDSSIKMLHLYHKYPARYIFSFSLALFPSHPLSYGNRQHHNPLPTPAHAYQQYLHKQSV